MRGHRRHPAWTFLATLAVIALGPVASAIAKPPSPVTFTETPLLRPEGYTEPAVTIGADGRMALAALAVQFDQDYAGGWAGSFGGLPAFVGPLDQDLEASGERETFGGSDVDIDIGSTGRLHASTLVARPPSFQLGISNLSCPYSGWLSSFSGCHRELEDSAGSDRQWITSDGPTVYLAYHDAGASGGIHVIRSDDDGISFKQAADPIVGSGSITAGATYNNQHGPIVADPRSHNVYISYVSGSPKTKANEILHNKVYVARSGDRGRSWTSSLVFEGPPDVDLGNFWPTLDVDPVTGVLYTAWTDRHRMMVSQSSDGGRTWSTETAVNRAPATTTVMPWVAAQGGVVDVAYYGTSGSSPDDRSSVWYVYLAQSRDGGATFQQTKVSERPNHVGPVCMEGSDCRAWRQLADLFEVDIDPRSGRAAVTYTTDNLGQPFTVTTGPLSGRQYLSAEGNFTRPVLVLPDAKLNGPTTYVGPAGCGGPGPPPARGDSDPAVDQIALIRHTEGCRFDAEAKAVLDAGYEGFVELLAERDDETQMVGDYRDLPGFSVNRTTAQALLGVSDVAQATVGRAGPSIAVGARRPQVVLAQQT
jgi:hypothetical protein